MTAGLAEVSWSAAAAWRFAAHGLAERSSDHVVAVARRLCGLHAQVMSSAELTAWARVEGLEREAVADALWGQAPTLVKAWAMRGTLHLLPRDELGLWLGGLSTMKHFLTPGWARGFGLEPGQIERVIEAVGVVLDDGRVLDRAGLAAAVAEEVGDDGLAEALSHSFGSTLKPAAFRGKLVFAQPDGQKVRFAAPPGDVEVEDGDAAMEAIVLRALAAHAPLTVDELTRWWLGSSSEVKRALKRLGDRVATVSVEGEARLARAEDVEALAGGASANGAPGAGVVRLLPAFDQYVVAATRHSDALTVGTASQAKRIYRPQGWLTPVVVVDGRFAGVWSWERKGKALLVEVELFAARIPKALRAGVEDEAARLAGFLGGALALRLGDGA
jgi:Winged helix DNA-binding domain